MSYDPYDSAADPEVDPEAEAFLNYLLGGQSQIFPGATAPSLYEAPYGMMAGLIPGTPEDDAMLDFLKSGTNYFQDVMQMGADPLIAGYAGPGAFATGAFEPIESVSVVDRPHYRRLAALATADPDSWQGMVARALTQGLDGQGSQPASVALRQIDAELDAITREHGPESDEWLAAVRRMGLPTKFEQGVEVLDREGLRFEARDMETGMFENDPQPGTFDAGEGKIGERFLDPETGELLERVVEPSPLTEHFRKLGLPSPTEEFTPEMMLGPEWVAQSQALTREPPDVANAEYLAAMQAQRDYLADLAAQPAPARTAGGGAEEAAATVTPAQVAEWREQYLGGGRGLGGMVSGPAAELSQAVETAAPALGTAALDRLFGPGWRTAMWGAEGDIPGAADVVRGNVVIPGGVPGAVATEIAGQGGNFLSGIVGGWGTPETARQWLIEQGVDPAEADRMIATGGAGGGGGQAGVMAPGGGDIASKISPAALAGKVRPADVPAPPQPPIGDFGGGISDFGGGTFPPSPRPPTSPPNQGGFAPDINLTPEGGLAGPPGRSPMDDAMLAALLGGGPLTGQLPWQAAPDRGVNLGAPVSAPTEQMRLADLAARQWQAAPGQAPPPQPAPPAYGPEWQAAPNRGIDLGRGLPAPDAQMRQAMLDAMVWRAAPGQGQPQSNYPPLSNMVEILGGGTGEITPANYGGGPALGGGQIAQWMVNASRGGRRPAAAGGGYPPLEDFLGVLGGETGPITPANYGGGPRGGPAGGTQIEEWLALATARPRRGGVRTGEERRRRQITEAEAEQQRRDIADPRTEWMRTRELPRRTNEAREAWIDAERNYNRQRRQTYGREFGEAVVAAGRLHQRGITPYIATMAARQQIPMAAGINTPGRVY